MQKARKWTFLKLINQLSQRKRYLNLFSYKMEDINWRDIRHTCCDLSGKKAKDKCPHHWYVILSRQKYNQQSNEILGVPLTSKQNYYSLTFGINITDDDI